jgi:hypothetical protein
MVGRTDPSALAWGKRAEVSAFHPALTVTLKRHCPPIGNPLCFLNRRPAAPTVPAGPINNGILYDYLRLELDESTKL